jgi:hypothetical protein
MAAALFIHRGVFRAVDSGLRDFAAPFAGTRLFWTGGNPFDAAALRTALDRAGASDTAPPPAVYPPASFVALTPFAALPAFPAKAFFLFVGLGLLAVGTAGWAREVGLPAAHASLLFALMVAGSPLHTALFVANPGLLAAGALLTGLWCQRRGQARIAGTLLLWSLLLKPQLGLVGLAALAWQREFRRAALLGCSALGLYAASFAFLHLTEPAALPQWQANLQAERAAGSISAVGALGLQRVDPASLWAAFSGTDIPQWLQALVAAGFVGLALPALRRGTDADAPVAHLAVLAVAVMLGTYHRAYDAVLLVPAWLFLAASAHSLAMGCVALLLCAGWLLPGAGFWLGIARPESLIGDAVASDVFQFTLARAHAWTVLLTAAAVLFVLHRSVRAQRAG